MGIAGIWLMSSEKFEDLRSRWDSNPTVSYSVSELDDVAFPLGTSMGGSNIVFKGDSYSEAENSTSWFWTPVGSLAGRYLCLGEGIGEGVG